MFRIRKKCEKTEHEWREIEGVPLPYIFCKRWFCDACAVSRWCPPAYAVTAHNAIPIEIRYPSVTLDESGHPIEEN